MVVISAELDGRLGNHLFIIATAAATARENNRALRIFNAGSEDAGFTLRCAKAGMANVGLHLELIAHRLRTKENVLQETGGSLAYEPLILSMKKDVHIAGFRQHYKYFAKHREWIINHVFGIPGRRAQALRDFGLPSLDGKIVVHIRRGDYASDRHLFSFLPVASDRYYVEALKQVAKRTGCTEAVIFCEIQSQTDVRKTLFPVLQKMVPEVTLEFAPSSGTAGKQHHAWHEMLWMSTASAFVNANSSFSWWAAWMSAATADQKVVTFPKEWMGLAYNYHVREMAIPELTEGFGLWQQVSNCKASQDNTVCKLGSDFAARICSVADSYKLATYDESGCGALDRDFTFCDNVDGSCRKVCVPNFCVVDLTPFPLVDGLSAGKFSFKVFTSVEELLQQQQNDENRWVFFRLDSGILLEHIFNDMWYLMQPIRFELDLNPAHNYKYGLRNSLYCNQMFAVLEASLRTTKVCASAWWQARPLQFYDKPPPPRRPQYKA